MKHLGDITKLNGAKIPKVDIITGGSPCQDLSVAGKREGLAGERSGLFMEQIRVIKEMRESDRANGRTVEHIRPRYMVWENVQGAFSSNKGEDFRCVLEETSKIADENAIIPRLETGKDGKQKWSKAGVIMGDGWSIAWRVHDAQFWGVPQRRKRISLVADFGGTTAPEILFERESLSRDTTESREEREGTTTDAERGIGETGESLSFQERAGKEGGGKGILIQKERTGALSTLNNQPVCYGISSYNSNAMKSSNPHSGIYEAETTRTLDNNGGNPACNQGGMAVVQGFDGFNLNETDEICPTLMCQRVDTKNIPSVVQSAGFDGYNQSIDEEVAQPLRAADGGDSTPKVCYRKTSHAKSKEDGQGWQETEVNDTLNIFDNGESRTPTIVLENHPNDSRVKIREDGKVQTLSSRMGTGGGNVPLVMEEPTCLTRRFSSVNVYEEGITPTLEAGAGGGGYNMPMVMESQAIESHAQDSRYKVNEINQPLSANMEHDAANGGLVMDNIQTIGHDLRSAKFTDDEITDPLTATDYKDPIKISYNSVVRRLTPLECERLQGFPDGWTDIGDWIDSKGKKHKGEADSPRYKALGNSIALPYWAWMAERMVKYIDHESTMGSLFDGIGGFPLVYSRVGCQPIWASEIEEFPIAVTKVRFPDDDED